ncbi:hypothetical protein BC940DRAFT_317700 [Gongronella butleri]|nr:hypothetical protein BC940DRAFT_317700 [Gongronella butleri]
MTIQAIFEALSLEQTAKITKEFYHGVQQLVLQKEMTDETILGVHRSRIAAFFDHFAVEYPDFAIARPHGHLEHAMVLNYQNAQLSTCLSNYVTETIKKGKALGVAKAPLVNKFDIEEDFEMPAIDEELPMARFNAAVEALRTALDVDTASMHRVMTLIKSPLRRDGTPVQIEAT